MSGRHPYEPTDLQRAEVSALVAFGITEVDISAYIGIAVNTLRKHFAEELKLGMVRANAAVTKRLYQKAVVDGDTTAIIWWQKNRMGWTDKAPGTTVNVGVTINANVQTAIQTALASGVSEATVIRAINSEVTWLNLPMEAKLAEARALVQSLEAQCSQPVST